MGPHDTALVTGLGPIGLLAAIVLAETGLRAVFATDIDADRRRIGESYGLAVMDPSEESVQDIIESETNAQGVDVAIDAVGAEATRQQCVRAVRWGGTVVLVGLHAEESVFPANYIIRSEITVQGSFAYAYTDFESALTWLADGRAPVNQWIEHAPLAEGGACFERLLARPGPVIKIMLDS